MQPRGRSVWLWIWSLLGIVLIMRAGLRDRGVITDHLEFGRRVLFGLDLYAPFEDPEKALHPVYPPSFGLLTAPLALFPERLARFLWVTLQVGSLWIIARRLAAAAPALHTRVHLVYVFAAILGARYILRDTHGGGGNLINLALVLVALDLAQRGREWTAGAVLGFSLATKPVAVLVLPLMWILGHRRAPGVAIAAAVGYLAVALLFLRQGMAPFLTWFDGSVKYTGMNDVFATPAGGFPPFSWMNQCLRCAIARFTGDVPAEFAAKVPGFFPGLGFDAGVTSWIARGLGLALLTVTFSVLWRGRSATAARPWNIAAVFALSLLLSPISWKAHHVALLPAFFAIGTVAIRGHRWPWVFAVAYFALCVVGEQFVGKDFKNIQQSLYLTTLGSLATLGICLWQVLRARATLPPPT